MMLLLVGACKEYARQCPSKKSVPVYLHFMELFQTITKGRGILWIDIYKWLKKSAPSSYQLSFLESISLREVLNSADIHLGSDYCVLILFQCEE